ncbi:hypothetical protein STCU_00085 [Strigomonas culicis]|uniref:Uncharacterized protein n=1 Tax=Strigomonas culicis TaxID=28005 RepID=S9WEN6_9TRYP|nr:hypothetical protein STCU_01801 [Strigomonas culicis]EPY37212.1 hypothetical protein STCU_00085 [Strigomonas culicis]|eukprot:EPY34170.1 hypothetical protein STCU_01801 [Strigomonas culicis]
MSADPDAPANPGRISGGHIIHNMIYSHDDANNLEIVSGWKEQGVREYNQEVVRPAKLNMHKKHPCYNMNTELVKCSLLCPPEMRLGGRTATCNVERQALMKCLVKNKKWSEKEYMELKPWYQFW